MNAINTVCAQIFIAAVAFGLPVIGCAKPTPAAPPSSSVKAVDTSGLAAPVLFDTGKTKFRIRPPKNLFASRQEANEFGRMYGWQGPPHGDRSCSSLTMSVGTFPKGEVPLPNEMLDEVMESLASQYKNLEVEKTQFMTIKNMKFCFTNWRALQPTVNAEMKGCEYVGVKGNDVFVFGCSDVKPFDSTTLALGKRWVESLEAGIK